MRPDKSVTSSDHYFRWIYCLKNFHQLSPGNAKVRVHKRYRAIDSIYSPLDIPSTFR